MNLLFKTTADGDGDTQDADFVVVEIDDAAESVMRTRAVWFESERVRIDFEEVAFVATNCTWLSEHTACEIFGDDLTDDDKPSPLFVPWSAASLKGYQEERVGCCRMVVTAHGFYWEGIVRHTDVTVRTRLLPWLGLGNTECGDAVKT